MRGKAIESLDTVVTKQTSAILFLDRQSDRVPNPGPCINCGWCQDDCPVGLDPQLLLEAAERGLPGTPASLLTVLLHPLRPGAAVLLALTAALGAALVTVGLFGRGLRDLFTAATATPRRALLTALALALLAGRFYADPGIPHQFDAKLHVMQAADTAALLGERAPPLWSFTFYAGFPIHRFEGPLFYLLASGPILITGSVSFGVKLVLLLAHLVGAAGTYRLGRRITGSPAAGVLAAVAVSFSFQHTHEIVLAGRFPVALAYKDVPGFGVALEVVLFIAILGLAIIFAWRKGVFTWSRRIVNQ